MLYQFQKMAPLYIKRITTRYKRIVVQGIRNVDTLELLIYGALAWWYGIISSFGCLSYLVGAARSFICKGRFFEGLN